MTSKLIKNKFTIVNIRYRKKNTTHRLTHSASFIVTGAVFSWEIGLIGLIGLMGLLRERSARFLAEARNEGGKRNVEIILRELRILCKKMLISTSE